MAPRAVIKIDFGTGVRLGPGKARLLECITETGSISAAARAMDMSYRRAWLLVDELNGMFGKPVVETAAGGAGGGGAKVTEFGLRVVGVFRQLETEADALAKARMAQLALT
jgi:molybdate transport system regulatory protein